MNNSFFDKKRSNSLVKIFLTILSWLVFIFFIGFIIFIFIQSVPGIKHYGFKNILFNNKFNINDPSSLDSSVWLPLSITLIIAFGALIISVPLAIKSASFIFFRIKNKKTFKWLKIIIEVSSGIPSVIFGLFASNAFGVVIQSIFGLNTVYTVLTAIFMLSFMIIPTIISLTINTYQNIDYNLISNSVSLGLSKTKSFYKIFRRESRGGILIGIIIALGRAIGETMAVSLILNSQDYSSIFASGFGEILSSSLAPLGSVISVGMFSENGAEPLKGLLFFYGIILFLIILFLNGFVQFISSSKTFKKYTWVNNFYKKINWFFSIIPNQISIFFQKIFLKKRYLDSLKYTNNPSEYISKKINKNKTHYFYSYYKIFWESLSIAIVLGFITWIILDILFKGFAATNSEYSTIFMYGKNTTGQATINTLLVIFISILITFPVSLLIAIFLNEYIKNKKIQKRILFFIDSLGSTPSIIYGMFGLVFFIEVLGISISGTSGKSLLAGILTVGMVILPNFIRNIQQNFHNIPNIIRENGVALGITKSQVIFKLVLPIAIKSIISSIVLSIGRILSETAPLYLTAGLSSSSRIALLNPGQTLTTRIYSQLYSSNSVESNNVMYESALSTIFLILILTIIGHLLIPYYKELKDDFLFRWNIYKQIKKQTSFKILKKYKTQIIDNILYLSNEQAIYLNLNKEQNKYIISRFKKIKIKYLSNEEFLKLKEGQNV